MVILFVLHTFVLGYFDAVIFQELLITCYVINALTAILFIGFLLWVSRINSALTGWVFLLTTALKFMLFFIIVYPLFQFDKETKTIEFFAFFTPYSLALFLEILQLSKILNAKK
tara:strand:- start:1459 stop:1800 length:342 start_codon:yes stop_codon:yes gene_type:complete